MYIENLNTTWHEKSIIHWWNRYHQHCHYPAVGPSAGLGTLPYQSYKDGKPLHLRSISQAIDAGLAYVAEKIKALDFDCVCDFIGFVPEQLERDYRLFNGKTRQFMYISSASAYMKPVRNSVIDESTPLANPYWEYSRNKIACEAFLMKNLAAGKFL